MKNLFIASFLACIVGTASAAARLVETRVQVSANEFQTYYAVEITATGADIGLPGGYFVGAVRNNSQLFYLAGGEWVSFSGGLAEAIENFTAMSSVPRYYHPLTGAAIGKSVNGYYMWGNSYGNGQLGVTRAEICMKAGSVLVDLYGGIGSLTRENEKLINTFHLTANPKMSLSHLRAVYIRQDMAKNNKIWNIGSFDCGDVGN